MRGHNSLSYRVRAEEAGGWPRLRDGVCVGGGGELAGLHFATLLPNFICWGYIRHSQIWHYWEATTLCSTGSGQRRLGVDGGLGCVCVGVGGGDGDWQWQCSDVAQRCPRAYRGWCVCVGGGGGREGRGQEGAAGPSMAARGAEPAGLGTRSSPCCVTDHFKAGPALLAERRHQSRQSQREQSAPLILLMNRYVHVTTCFRPTVNQYYWWIVTYTWPCAFAPQSTSIIDESLRTRDHALSPHSQPVLLMNRYIHVTMCFRPTVSQYFFEEWERSCWRPGVTGLVEGKVLWGTK